MLPLRVGSSVWLAGTDGLTKKSVSWSSPETYTH